ncbi:TPA: hypothetical protein N0F65_007133 [Lagenidium giganteum]|uniref:Uncharacterized protein n=1 Tax=Lagenidium giganteum TaxID=4803 RepID=A0AAV2YVJ2_9STRA|nr:TPA: hypothetical protein N0F65_007133 [Lagenidium giganteum]
MEFEGPHAGMIVPMDGESPRITPFKPKQSFGRRGSWRDLLGWIYNWLLWCGLIVLLFSQLFGIIWNTITTTQEMEYGKSPLEGTYAIDGSNDEPYADRLLICTLQGRMYKPIQLNLALADKRAAIVDINGTSVNGYRVIPRNGVILDPEVYDTYVQRCDVLASTIDAIFDSCAALGYNVTKDDLRIVNGINSNTTILIPSALPVLLLPYWDNSIYARYAIPGWDGNACVFRLLGKYDVSSLNIAYLQGVNRTVRESKTIEWLGPAHANGSWRNGWYEDFVGMKWYSDVISTNAANTLGIMHRQFDTLNNQEVNCTTSPLICQGVPVTEWWGKKSSSTTTAVWYNSVAISNGTRFGLFLYEALEVRVIVSAYDLETFLANLSIAMIFFRWMICMMALQNGYWSGLTRWWNAGIGCLSCSRSFHVLPIMLLPRLKTSLAAFFALGCSFEGEEKSLSDAWFSIYPSIAEVMLFYYSIVNVVAKLLRRRMSDVLFGPSIMILCLLHGLRVPIARTGWLEFDGRVTTVMSSRDFEKLNLVDLFISDAALRMNGNVQSLFWFKLSILALNLVPLLFFSESTSIKGRTARTIPLCRFEKALAVRVSTTGGWGKSPMYEFLDASGTAVSVRRRGGSVGGDCGPPRAMVNAYELVRLGYIVLGGKFVLRIDDWYVFMLLAAYRRHPQPPPYRMTIFAVREQLEPAKTRYISDSAHMFQLNDARLHSISAGQIVACPFH